MRREQERLGGAAMIAGAAMGLVTMAFHPTGHAILRDATGTAARVSAGVHALALAALPVAFYGALALTRRLSPRRALAELALAFHGAGAVATMLAAVASGFLSTDLLVSAAEQTGAAREATLSLVAYSGAFNQAFARTLVGMASVAILLWSIGILRTRLLRRASGLLGGVVAAVTLALLLGGRLRLDVHGFGAVVLAQAVWLALVGTELLRGPRRDGGAA